MHIALVSPEIHSLLRPTNLAGITESLARALHAARQDVRVFLPWSQDVQTEPLGPLAERATVKVPDGNGTQEFRVLEGLLGELPVYLFENEAFFGARHPYGDVEGPYPDNWRRYVLFVRAVLESIDALDFRVDVFHCMDWTTGMLPLLQQLDYIEAKPQHPSARAGTYFAIHNLAMQGVFEREILPHIGVPHSYFKHVEGVELAGKVNFLKTGAEFATILGTHSPSHALKIQEMDRGYGLESTFRRRKKELLGINNGIDYDAWNPAVDPALPANFDGEDMGLTGKKKCKAALQAALQLDNGPRTPIACCIGRWDADSGFDLVIEVLTELLERNVELILMGQGSPEISQKLMTAEKAFMGRIRIVQGYNAHTAHMMMAGSDILLLPFHYQPANPLFAIALRYGVLPIVYARGGLESAVVDIHEDPENGLGFHFEPYTAQGLMDCLVEAIKVYRDADAWTAVVQRALAQDFSWTATAAEYQKAYRRVTRRVKQRLAAG